MSPPSCRSPAGFSSPAPTIGPRDERPRS
jgi:hypothetical protein